MNIKSVTTFSHQGSRSGQEDFVMVEGDRKIFAVADGFGGPSNGAKAAQVACESVKRFLVKEAGDREATLPFILRSYFSLAGNVLFNALIFANRNVNRLNQKKNVHDRGGASVIAGYMDGDLLAIANVGACSAWLFRSGKAIELVIPRTYGRLLDPFESAFSIEYQAPLMALGITEDLEPEIFEYRIREGDWLLFHTDGLESSIREQIVSMSPSEVMEFLKKCTYRDNVAAAMVVF